MLLYVTDHAIQIKNFILRYRNLIFPKNNYHKCMDIFDIFPQKAIIKQIYVDRVISNFFFTSWCRTQARITAYSFSENFWIFFF